MSCVHQILVILSILAQSSWLTSARMMLMMTRPSTMLPMLLSSSVPTGEAGRAGGREGGTRGGRQAGDRAA